MDLEIEFAKESDEVNTRWWTKWVVERACALDAKCTEYFTRRSEDGKGKDKKTQGKDAEARKKRARERAMKAMKTSANNFANQLVSADLDNLDPDNNNNEKIPVPIDSSPFKKQGGERKSVDSDLENIEKIKVDDSRIDNNEITCIICQTGNNNQNQDPLLYLAFTHSSRIFYKPLVSPSIHVSASDDINNIGIDGEVENDNGAVNINEDCPLRVSACVCGHCAHLSCLSAFLKSADAANDERDRRLLVDKSRNQFLCPLCRSLNNSYLPLINCDFKFNNSDNDEIGGGNTENGVIESDGAKNYKNTLSDDIEWIRNPVLITFEMNIVNNESSLPKVLESNVIEDNSQINDIVDNRNSNNSLFSGMINSLKRFAQQLSNATRGLNEIIDNENNNNNGNNELMEEEIEFLENDNFQDDLFYYEVLERLTEPFENLNSLNLKENNKLNLTMFSEDERLSMLINRTSSIIVHSIFNIFNNINSNNNNNSIPRILLLALSQTIQKLRVSRFLHLNIVTLLKSKTQNNIINNNNNSSITSRPLLSLSLYEFLILIISLQTSDFLANNQKDNKEDEKDIKNETKKEVNSKNILKAIRWLCVSHLTQILIKQIFDLSGGFSDNNNVNNNNDNDNNDIKVEESDLKENQMKLEKNLIEEQPYNSNHTVFSTCDILEKSLLSLSEIVTESLSPLLQNNSSLFFNKNNERFCCLYRSASFYRLIDSLYLFNNFLRTCCFLLCALDNSLSIPIINDNKTGNNETNNNESSNKSEQEKFREILVECSLFIDFLGLRELFQGLIGKNTNSEEISENQFNKIDSDSKSDVKSVVRQWLSEFIEHADSSCKTDFGSQSAHLGFSRNFSGLLPAGLLSLCHSRSVPRLLQLPHSFTQLHSLVRAVSNLDHPAVCLRCGSVIDAEGKGLCSRHSRSCCGDGAVFLLVSEHRGLLMHGLRAAYCASPYTDLRGETHRHSRGRPLSLDAQRLLALRAAWARTALEVAARRASSTHVLIMGYY